MSGIIAGFVILSIAYITGVTLALFKENWTPFVATCKDVVEAIQDIKEYKANQGTKGS